MMERVQWWQRERAYRLLQKPATCWIQLALGLSTRAEAVLAGAASVIYGTNPKEDLANSLALDDDHDSHQKERNDEKANDLDHGDHLPVIRAGLGAPRAGRIISPWCARLRAIRCRACWGRGQGKGLRAVRLLTPLPSLAVGSTAASIPQSANEPAPIHSAALRGTSQSRGRALLY